MIKKELKELPQDVIDYYLIQGLCLRDKYKSIAKRLLQHHIKSEHMTVYDESYYDTLKDEEFNCYYLCDNEFEYELISDSRGPTDYNTFAKPMYEHITDIVYEHACLIIESYKCSGVNCEINVDTLIHEFKIYMWDYICEMDYFTNTDLIFYEKRKCTRFVQQ